MTSQAAVVHCLARKYRETLLVPANRSEMRFAVGARFWMNSSIRGSIDDLLPRYFSMSRSADKESLGSKPCWLVDSLGIELPVAVILNLDHFYFSEVLTCKAKDLLDV